MAFRADEAAEDGYNHAKRYLIPASFTAKQKQKSEAMLMDIIDELGPVVSAYPSWHPLVAQHEPTDLETFPSQVTGYKGLDHTIYFTHGFITCPYHGEEEVIKSAHLIEHDLAVITAEKLNVNFYMENAKPVLVKCEWLTGARPAYDGKISKSIAVPLMMKQELSCWRERKIAEKWETVRPYLLGQPHGSRSSLFVTQETAMAMKKAYMTMVESGMFGPLRMD